MEKTFKLLNTNSIIRINFEHFATQIMTNYAHGCKVIPKRWFVSVNVITHRFWNLNIWWERFRRICWQRLDKSKKSFNVSSFLSRKHCLNWLNQIFNFVRFWKKVKKIKLQEKIIPRKFLSRLFSRFNFRLGVNPLFLDIFLEIFGISGPKNVNLKHSISI